VLSLSSAQQATITNTNIQPRAVALAAKRRAVCFAAVTLLFVVINSSSPLTYCTIFIAVFSEVVGLHICICIRTSHCLYQCTHRLRAAAALPWPAALQPTQFSGHVDLFSPVCYRMTRRHVIAAVFKLGRDLSTLFKSDVVE